MICGCIGVVAEVSYEALKKRYDQGWVLEIIDDVDALVSRLQVAKKNKEVKHIWNERVNQVLILNLVPRLRASGSMETLSRFGRSWLST